jgi:hypothetical protein
MAAQITNIYIDGFNLYYGALKGTPFKWLDVNALCSLVLPASHHQIHRIKYFTALVEPRPGDPEQPLRQQTYLRALRTIPHLSIYYGHFLSRVVPMHLAPPSYGTVRVIRTDEKGSDVNLATHLLADGFRHDYDAAVIVSNDSDLLAPLLVAKNELSKAVGVLCPHKHPSVDLQHNATFFKSIRQSALAKCQFAHTLTDTNGPFSKPATW